MRNQKTMTTGTMLGRLETAAEKAARSMLRRRDIKVLVAGTGACYVPETKTLHVPAYSLNEDARPDHVNAWRGLLDHECAHVEYTDFEAWTARKEAWAKDPKFDVGRCHTLFNVFEDFTIERRWCETRPGSVAHLEATLRIVVEETGGAQACDPEYQPAGSEGPAMGVFGAFVQSILRVFSGAIDIKDVVNPDIQALLDLCADEIAVGIVAKDSVAALDAAEAVWLKLNDCEGSEGEAGEDGSGGEAGEDGSEGEEGADGSEGEEGEDGSEGGEGEEGEEGDDGSEGGEGSEGESGEDGEDGSDGDSDKGKPGDATEGKPGDSTEGKPGDNPGEKPQEGDPGGVGLGSFDLAELRAEATGGTYSEIESSDIVARLFVPDANSRPYTIHPASTAADKWVSFDSEMRSKGRPVAKILRSKCTAAASVLGTKLRTALKSQKRSLWVGGLEEGTDLDPDGLPGLASGRYDPRIFADHFTQQHDNTFVTILVDCSGSMGNVAPIRVCPEHGHVKQKGTKCSRKVVGGSKCGMALEWLVNSKAAYAAMTTMTIHDALRSCGVQHAVLGYTTTYNWMHETNPTITGQNAAGRKVEWPQWSRFRTALCTFEFVPAPGLADDGAALAYIDGHGGNCDGDSLLLAAEYMVKKAQGCTRMITIVVSDGLPSGADDRHLNDKRLTDAVSRVAAAGIEVYGVGVGLGRSDQKKFAKFYPDRPPSGHRAATGSVLLGNATGLDRAVMTKLSKLLIKSNGQSRGGRR